MATEAKAKLLRDIRLQDQMFLNDKEMDELPFHDTINEIYNVKVLDDTDVYPVYEVNHPSIEDRVRINMHVPVRSLNWYVEAGYAALQEESGAFYAFSQAMFDEKKKEGEKYTKVGTSGLICPVDSVNSLADKTEELFLKGMKQRLEDYGKERLIQYEMSNHEVQFSNDIATVCEVLDPYGITVQEVADQHGAFMLFCKQNDMI